MSDIVDPGPTDLYRFYDHNNRLLYVGISFSAVARASQHRSDKGWWPDVAHMDVEHLGSRKEALDAEMRAIHEERPIYNVIGNSKPAVPPPWRCMKCRVGIGLKKQDGYIQADAGDEWSCVCVKCDDGDDRYWIDVASVKTIEDIERWTQHLADKNWFDQSSWVYMVKKCSTLPQAHIKAFLAFDAHRDMRRRQYSRREFA